MNSGTLMLTATLRKYSLQCSKRSQGRAGLQPALSRAIINFAE